MKIVALVMIMIAKLKAFFERAISSPDVPDLTPESAELMEETISDAMSEAGRAGLKAYLESQDVKEATVEKEGRTLRFKQESPKKFLTEMGLVEVTRRLYQADSGGASSVPLDELWGMEGEFATKPVREAVLFGSSHLSPGELSSMLKKSSLFHPSPSAIQNIINEAGAFIEEHRNELHDDVFAHETAPEDAKVFTASLDGANVLLNEAGKKRGRPAERPMDKANEEKQACYKNAMVGSFSYYGDVLDGETCPVRLASRYTARMPEERYPTFKAQFERELDHAEATLRAAAKTTVTKVLLADGHRSIWGYIEGNDRFTDYTKIIDFFHATEHLSSASEAVFGKKSDLGKEWFKKWKRKLKTEDDAVTALILSMDYYSRKSKLTKSRIDQLKTERGYFARNKTMMQYAEYRRRGLPIGSGPIEAACKTIVKQRLCRSGMRWSRVGGQHVLYLRSIVKSQRWNVFWKAYDKIRRNAA